MLQRGDLWLLGKYRLKCGDMAGIEVEEFCEIPDGMVKRILRQQMYLQAEVPHDVKTPDAYTKTFEYTKQNGYSLDEYDEIEVYEEVFKDPDYHAFKLLMPIKLYARKYVLSVNRYT